MSGYKDEKTGKWYALTWYHDWKGEGRQKCKRGFETKKDALEWERTFLQQNATDMDMTFSAFCELYERDRRPRLKESTWQTKANIIQGKLIPVFGKRIISEIGTKDIIAWQNELLAYRDTSQQVCPVRLLVINQRHQQDHERQGGKLQHDRVGAVVSLLATANRVVTPIRDMAPTITRGLTEIL